jgi:hypothetical protein
VKREQIEYNGYMIEAVRFGRHGYGATATLKGHDGIADDPPNRYHTTKLPVDFKGPGAKQRAIEAVKGMVDAGPNPVLIFTVVDRDTGSDYGEVRAPSREVAKLLVLREWGNVPGLRLEVKREPQQRPWDWNDGNLYRRL